MADEPGHCGAQHSQLEAQLGAYDPETRLGSGWMIQMVSALSLVNQLQSRFDEAKEEVLNMPDYGLESMFDDVQEPLDRAREAVMAAINMVDGIKADLAAGLAHAKAGRYDAAHLCWTTVEGKLNQVSQLMETWDTEYTAAASALDDLLNEIDNYKNPPE